MNAIAPGGIKTDMFDENAWHYVPKGYPGMPMEVIEAGLANQTPLKRCGLTSDIAKAVALLVSPDSEWINGESPNPNSEILISKLTRMFCTIGQVIKLSGGAVA